MRNISVIHRDRTFMAVRDLLKEHWAAGMKAEMTGASELTLSFFGQMGDNISRSLYSSIHWGAHAL